MTLHLIMSSPIQTSALNTCLEVMQSGDVLVLLADGVYSGACEGMIPDSHMIYYIREDAKQRGVDPPPYFCPLEYAGLVSLTEQHAAIHT